MKTLVDRLDGLSTQGGLYEKLTDRAVRCMACAHRCKINDGKRGVCQVRFNQDGELRVPWGYVSGLQVDPIEKKPFSHFMPGANALTFGMLGCDFHCDYCQNWLTSQALRDPASDISINLVEEITPRQIVKAALRSRSEIIVSSYNEPLITSEWAVSVFKEAVAENLLCAYVSNGNATPEALAYLRPYLAAYKIDLKSMQQKNYRKLGGVLKHVLDTIQKAYELGMWVEVVTLLVPDFNDSIDEIHEMARFIFSVSADIPWHVTAFHRDYKMTKNSNTSPHLLVQAADIGREAGLRYVYAGNLPGAVGEYENTHCPNCHKVLVHRRGYVIQNYQITSLGTCSSCGTKIAGIWPENPESVNINLHRLPFQVY